jgi:arsenical pump membrane protein
MALPALVAVVVTLLVLGLRYRRELRGTYEVPAHPGVEDRLVFWVAAGVCLAIGPLIVTGLGVAPVAVGAALALVLVYAVRRRSALRFALVPWRLVLLVTGLFLVIAAFEHHGLSHQLGHAAGTGIGFTDLFRLAGVAAVGSNVANNLPAYLALEPTADSSTPRILALLIGTNVGPLVLLWGSLATLLWRERCRARGVEVSAKEFALLGLAGVPLLLVSCVAALVVR